MIHSLVVDPIFQIRTIQLLFLLVLLSFSLAYLVVHFVRVLCIYGFIKVVKVMKNFNYDPTLVWIADPKRVDRWPHEPKKGHICNCEIAGPILTLLFYDDVQGVILAYLHHKDCSIFLQKLYDKQSKSKVIHPCINSSFDPREMPLTRNALFLYNKEERGVHMIKYLLFCKQEQVDNCIIFTTPKQTKGLPDPHLRYLIPDCLMYDHLDTNCLKEVHSRIKSFRMSPPSCLDNPELLLIVHGIVLSQPEEFKRLVLNGCLNKVGIWMSSPLKKSLLKHLRHQIDILFLDVQDISDKDKKKVFQEFSSIFAMGANLEAFHALLTEHASCKNCWIVFGRKRNDHLYVPPILPPFQLRHGTMFEMAGQHEIRT
jgi:hypothetical protein